MLDPTVLASSLLQIERTAILQGYTEAGLPPVIDPATEARLSTRCTSLATAIHAWILTATVNSNVTTSVTTTHAPGTILVVGSPSAQSNVIPIVGTGAGTGTAIGTLS